MNSEKLAEVLTSARDVFDSHQYEWARNICVENLKSIDKEHVCFLFGGFLILAAKSHVKLSESEPFDKNLVALESFLFSERCCVLTHSLRGNDVFSGTRDSFSSYLPLEGDTEVFEIGCCRLDHIHQILEFLCNLCLDLGLYAPALNLALQLHWIARQKAPSFPNSSFTPNTAVPCDSIVGSIDVNTELPPVGLSLELWTRLTFLCQWVSPVIAPYDEINLLSSCTAKCSDSSLSFENSSGSNLTLSPDMLAPPHFTAANKFSEKVERLRSNMQTLHRLSDELTDRCFHGLPDSSNRDYVADIYETNACEYFANHAEEPSEDLDHATFDDDEQHLWKQHCSDFADSSNLHELEFSPCFCPSTMNAEVFDSFGNEGDSPSVSEKKRGSILRYSDKSVVEAEGDQTRPIRKRVRFSLGSFHPSPALENEYGGRSNRRRLIDFARRRQLLTNGRNSSDGLTTDDLYSVLFFATLSPVSVVFRCIRAPFVFLAMLLHIRIGAILWLLFAVLAMFFVAVLSCYWILYWPWPNHPVFLNLGFTPTHFSSWLTPTCSAFLDWFDRNILRWVPLREFSDRA